ncbi:MAG: DUF1796 family putative cysteine peptidase [Candidatus Paceibacterota bacterium]
MYFDWGWCGTRMALDKLKITNEPNNIFDHIRSSSKGILDCIQDDFSSFLPENKKVDTRFKNWKPFIGEHFGFYHSPTHKLCLVDGIPAVNYFRKFNNISA